MFFFIFFIVPFIIHFVISGSTVLASAYCALYELVPLLCGIFFLFFALLSPFGDFLLYVQCIYAGYVNVRGRRDHPSSFWLS